MIDWMEKMRVAKAEKEERARLRKERESDANFTLDLIMGRAKKNLSEEDSVEDLGKKSI